MLRLLLPEMVLMAPGVGEKMDLSIFENKFQPGELEINEINGPRKSIVSIDFYECLLNGHRFFAFGSMNRRPRSLKTVDAKEGPGAYQWASRGQGWPRSGKITGIMIRNRCFQWS